MTVPKEVMWVLAVQATVRYVGSDTMDKMNDIIKRYPEYFVWEHGYANVPKSVHEAYCKEVSPELWRARYGNESISCEENRLDARIKESRTYYSFEKTPEQLIDCLKAFNDEQIKKRNELSRRKKLWKKHYGKYNLEYRDTL